MSKDLTCNVCGGEIDEDDGAQKCEACGQVFCSNACEKDHVCEEDEEDLDDESDDDDEDGEAEDDDDEGDDDE